MLKLDKNTHIAVRYLVIFIGAILYAVAIALLLDPNNLAPGGVTGIAIIINHLVPLPTGALILCMNIPLMLVGAWKFGLRFLSSTVFVIVVSSAVIDLIAAYGPLTQDRFLAAVFGGALLAIGMGMIFKAGGTTGGTDIIVRLLKLRYKHIKTGQLFLLTDVIVVAASAVVFRDVELGMYAAVAAFVLAMVFDVVLYGADSAKLVYIITDHADAVTERVLKELEVGVTHLKGTGAYTDKDKQVIMCAVRKNLLPQVQDIAHEEDPYAFLIVTSANEIFGQGFKDIKGERI